MTSARAHDVSPPEPVYQPAAPWPGGKVAHHDIVIPVELVVDRTGRVTEVQLEAGVGEPFDAIALQTARRWRFRPATTDEGPIPARIRAVVRFVGSPRTEREAVTPADSQPASTSEAPDASVEAQPHTHVDVHGETPARTASAVVRKRPVLEAAPHRTGSDLLLTVPGVFVTQHSGEGKAHQIFFRGFDSVHGQDLEIWVGGAPVNEVSHIHGQGYADLHFVMPEVVERLEALPGVYDPAQGDFAVAGSLRFELGYDEPGVTTRLGAGSFGMRRGFVGYHPEGHSAATFAAAEIYQTDGFGVGRAADRASGIVQLEHPLARSTRLRVLTSVYGARFGSAGVLLQSDVDRGALDRSASYDTNQGGSSTRAQLVTALEHDDGDSEVHVAPFVVLRGLRLRYDYTGYLEHPVLGDSTVQRNDAVTLGTRAHYRKHLDLFRADDAIEAGLVLRHDAIDQSQDDVAVADGALLEPVVDARVHATEVGAYLDTELHPFSRVALRGGVRADALSFAIDDHLSDAATRSSQGAVVSERAVVDVTVAPRLHALLSFGRGFRSPQARSLADGENAPFTRVVSTELGLRYRHPRRLLASLAGFRTQLSDDLVFDERLARNEPVPGTLRLGLAANVESSPVRWFTSALGFTYTRATFTEAGGRFNEGDLLAYVPQVVARSDMAVRPELGTLAGRRLVAHVGTGAQYLARRPLPFSEFGRDVFLLDARASLRAEEIELGLDVYNVLDTAWNDGEFVYASNFRRGATPSLVPARHITAGAPRTWLLSLTLYV